MYGAASSRKCRTTLHHFQCQHPDGKGSTGQRFIINKKYRSFGNKNMDHKYDLLLFPALLWLALAGTIKFGNAGKTSDVLWRSMMWLTQNNVTNWCFLVGSLPNQLSRSKICKPMQYELTFCVRIMDVPKSSSLTGTCFPLMLWHYIMQLRIMYSVGWNIIECSGHNCWIRR